MYRCKKQHPSGKLKIGRVYKASRTSGNDLVIAGIWFSRNNVNNRFEYVYNFFERL